MPRRAVVMLLAAGVAVAFVTPSYSEPKAPTSIGKTVSRSLGKMCAQQWESCWKACGGGRLCLAHCEQQYQSCLKPKTQPK